MCDNIGNRCCKKPNISFAFWRSCQKCIKSNGHRVRNVGKRLIIISTLDQFFNALSDFGIYFITSHGISENGKKYFPHFGSIQLGMLNK